MMSSASPAARMAFSASAAPSCSASSFASRSDFFYLIWGFVALTIFLFHRLKQSRFGRALNYLREDEVAAEGSGDQHGLLQAGGVWGGRGLGGHGGHIYSPPR